MNTCHKFEIKYITGYVGWVLICVILEFDIKSPKLSMSILVKWDYLKLTN